MLFYIMQLLVKWTLPQTVFKLQVLHFRLYAILIFVNNLLVEQK